MKLRNSSKPQGPGASVDLERWLRHLLNAHGVGLALGLLSLISFLEVLCSVGSLAVSLAVVYILYRLKTWQAGYGRAAMFMGLGLACQLIIYCFNLLMIGQVAFTPEVASQLGVISGAMVAGSMVCSLIGLYYVYHTHSILAPAMSRRWYGLFLGTLGCAAVVSVVTAVAAAMSLTWLAAAATLVYGLTSFAFEILRLLWLRDMIRQFS